MLFVAVNAVMVVIDAVDEMKQQAALMYAIPLG